MSETTQQLPSSDSQVQAQEEAPDDRPWPLRNLPKNYRPEKRKPVHTPEQIIAAIKGTGGIKTAIAMALKVERSTIDNYLRRWPSVQAAYDAEVEAVGDFAESVIISTIKGRDPDMAKWYAKTKLRNRGYVERTETTGADGGPILIKGYTVLSSPDDWPDPNVPGKQ